jgi:hypothetical protein
MSDPADTSDNTQQQDGSSGDGEQSKERNFDAMFADHRKRTVRDVKTSLDQRMQDFVTKDDFSAFQKSVLDVLKGNQGSEPQPNEGDPQDGDGGEKHETPTEVQMKKIMGAYEAQQKEMADLKAELEKEKNEALVASDHRFFDDLFAKNGVPAELAKQARTLFLTEHEIVRDEEKGRVHEIKGEYGPEIVTPDDLIPKWLDSNPHFFGARKSGSGAGANSGGNQRASRPLDLSKLAENPDEYFKNRDKIHSQLEGR